MTGDEVREFYSKMKSANKIKVVINGQEIPYMSDYTFVDAKSFFKEPVRSASGVIENLNSYATFLTPRLKINFKFMPIETYRVLMKLIKDFNEFIVTVYDIVEDKYVTHKMYFYPKEFPAIYQNNLETLAILDESFELVGTNASLEELSIVYNSNPPVEGQTTLTSGATLNYNDEFMVGTYDAIDEGSIDPTTFTYSGYDLIGWNTKADGSGITYLNGDTINNLSSSIVLYAVWKASTEFVLSLDYQNATAGIDIANKTIIQNTQIGELPSPIRNGYVFSGWFTEPNGNGVQITATSTYTFSGNKTIYAYWVGVKNSIIFDTNGGFGSLAPIENAENGKQYTLPKATGILQKQGYVFSHWNTKADDSDSGTKYNDEQTITMGDQNLALYAIYTKGFVLTYNTNGGTNDGSVFEGVYFKDPITTTKSGYYFAGWYEDEHLSNGVVFPITLKADATIYARWEEITSE